MAAALIARNCVAVLLSTTKHLLNTIMGCTKIDVSSKLESNSKPYGNVTFHRYNSKLQTIERCG